MYLVKLYVLRIQRETEEMINNLKKFTKEEKLDFLSKLFFKSTMHHFEQLTEDEILIETEAECLSLPSSKFGR